MFGKENMIMLIFPPMVLRRLIQHGQFSAITLYRLSILWVHKIINFKVAIVTAHYGAKFIKRCLISTLD